MTASLALHCTTMHYGMFLFLLSLNIENDDIVPKGTDFARSSLVVSVDHCLHLSLVPSVFYLLTLAFQMLILERVEDSMLTVMTASSTQIGNQSLPTPSALKRYVQWTKSQYAPEKMNFAARHAKRTDIERALVWFRLILLYRLLTLAQYFPMPRPAVGLILTIY